VIKIADVAQIMLYIQLGVVLAGLVIGSVYDLVKREVSDIPWIVIGGVGIITSIVYLILIENKSQAGLLIGVNFGVGIIIGFLLYYTGVMGGADAKALMALSVNTAIYPFAFPLISLPIYNIVPSIFNTFFNWLLIMVILYPIPLLVYNFIIRMKRKSLFNETEAKLLDKLLILISGYLIPVKKAKDRLDIVYSEVYNEEKERWEVKNFIQVPELEEEEKFKQEIEKHIEQTGKKMIWVKVLPPGIVFLLLGYIIDIFLGNLLFLVYHFTL